MNVYIDPSIEVSEFDGDDIILSKDTVAHALRFLGLSDREIQRIFDTGFFLDYCGDLSQSYIYLDWHPFGSHRVVVPMLEFESHDPRDWGLTTLDARERVVARDLWCLLNEEAS
jgi:hypothetical protein